MQLISTISSALPPALPGIAGCAFSAIQIMASATSFGAETNADTVSGKTRRDPPTSLLASPEGETLYSAILLTPLPSTLLTKASPIL